MYHPPRRSITRKFHNPSSPLKASQTPKLQEPQIFTLPNPSSNQPSPTNSISSFDNKNFEDKFTVGTNLSRTTQPSITKNNPPSSDLIFPSIKLKNKTITVNRSSTKLTNITREVDYACSVSNLKASDTYSKSIENMAGEIENQNQINFKKTVTEAKLKIQKSKQSKKSRSKSRESQLPARSDTFSRNGLNPNFKMLSAKKKNPAASRQISDKKTGWKNCLQKFVVAWCTSRLCVNAKLPCQSNSPWQNSFRPDAVIPDACCGDMPFFGV